MSVGAQLFGSWEFGGEGAVPRGALGTPHRVIVTHVPPLGE